MSNDLTSGTSPRDVPLSQRIAQIRYEVNWQSTAVRMQYERLAAHLQLPQEEQLAAHMRAVVDMDFMITAVRRLLRVAERARRIGVDGSGELRQAVRAIAPQSAQVVRVRNALEHLDQPGGGHHARSGRRLDIARVGWRPDRGARALRGCRGSAQRNLAGHRAGRARADGKVVYVIAG